MSWSMLAILLTIGLLTTGFAATASRALQEFSRRELEVYSRRRKRSDRFGMILDHYEQAAIGLESLQIIGTVLSVLTLTIEGLQAVHAADLLTVQQFLSIAAVATVLLLAVTIWIPEAMVSLWTAPFVFHSWPLLRAITFAMWPLTLGVKFVAAFLRRLADRPEEDDDEGAFDDEIRSIVTEGLYDGVLEQEEREMIEGVIELGDTEVADIMTPRSHVDALDVSMDWDAVVSFVVQAGRTRIPVYDKKLDAIVGVLYVKDLLSELSAPAPSRKNLLRELLRPPYFVPKTKPIDELLHDFKENRNHLAIVVDEYSSVAGVVTIEDVLEEIVGEIVDESDHEQESDFYPINDTTVEVLGTVHVHVVNERLGLELPEPDTFDTIAGLFIARVGRIPKPGESVAMDGARLTVVEGSRRCIERLRIEILQPS